jgi:hypothetical protein
MFDEDGLDEWIVYEAAEAADKNVLKCPAECGGMLFEFVTDDFQGLCCDLCGGLFCWRDDENE